MNLATRCGSALSRHPVPVEAVGECAGEILDLLDGERPDMLVCLASPHHAGALEDVVGGLRKLVEPDVLVAGVFGGVAGGSTEVEDGPALSVLATDFGGGHATAVGLEAHPEAGGMTITGWPEGLAASGTLLLLADLATFPTEDFLALVNANLPDLAVVGGVSAVGSTAGENRLALDDRVLAAGAVGVLLDAAVPVRTIVSQGCRPVGQQFTVTRSEGSRVQELAGRPALERLREVAAAMADEGADDLMKRGLHVGIVLDEHKVDPRRGDFLVRALQDIDELGGAISMGAPVEVGRTVQFQVRDSESADDDLRLLLGAAGGPAAAAVLFLGNGRGEQLFGEPDHDASLVQEVAGPLPLAGAFCASEIGSVGGRSERHGFTATAVMIG